MEESGTEVTSRSIDTRVGTKAIERVPFTERDVSSAQGWEESSASDLIFVSESMCLKRARQREMYQEWQCSCSHSEFPKVNDSLKKREKLLLRWPV